MGLRKQGKDYVFLTGFILTGLAFFNLMVSYVTPYWVQSWPRVYSQFKRIGMWEACFAGLVLPMDPEQHAYHGCWWVLAKEFDGMRDWMLPPWYVTTQIVTTICVIVELAALIIQGMVNSKSQIQDATGYTRRLPPFNLVQATTYITVATAVVKSLTGIMFAVAFYMDHNWMPRPDLNYLSWSYGLFLLSAFFSIFASIAHVVFNRIIRQESREAPRIPLNPSRQSSAPPLMSSLSLQSSRSKDFSI